LVPATPQSPERVEHFARLLLTRWGVIFRDLLKQESIAPPWRDLLTVLRRFEAQGEVRGGRFVSGYSGEQFALPEAIDLLRAVRRTPDKFATGLIAPQDPLNLTGVLIAIQPVLSETAA
jgi:ATP-dependent Lhr-like helicase